MKILLATGIFYPDVGGPATHVWKIAERLLAAGLEVVILSYGDDRSVTKLPFRVVRISRHPAKIWQWALYFCAAIRLAWWADLVYAFDLTAAGLPACVTARVFGRPFIIRIGGDPIWERQVEQGKVFVPLADYYTRGLYRQDRPILFWLIKFILRQARVVVLYNQFFRDFYKRYFSVEVSKIRIVNNPVYRRGAALPVLPGNPTILFAGRFVKYKNLVTVIKVFHRLRRETGRGRLLLIGDGPEKAGLQDLVQKLELVGHIDFMPPLSQNKLFEQIQQAAFCLGPAWSEFNPNFILESLSWGKPVLLSRGHGLSIDLPEEFLFDPLAPDELEQKMKFLFDQSNYRRAVATVASLPMDQSWEKVTAFHLNLVKEFGVSGS